MSRYAFVLTGTPIENRIDELYSIVDFLDPELLGSLFRFNRDFYQFDEKGRPSDYKNLSALRERVHPVLLRRRKHHVETEIPDRSDRNHFVQLTPAMRAEYDNYKQQVSQLVQKSMRRPLTKKEQDLLMILLGMMRMICDTPSIIKNHDCQDCPKLDELARVLDECLSDPDVKVLIFSEWEGMLKKVRGWAENNGIGYAWHTGSVPQQRRRGEILAFRNDPDCRLFISTYSGGVGLNLQNASVVINCDLPWNPARLEQRIARAWRKHQRRAVTVVNLIAEGTIEHAMLATLANKMTLAKGVLEVLHREIDWRGNTPALHLLDETTWSSIQQLVASGFLTLNTRATHPLSGEGAQARPALTAEQLQRIHDLRAFAAKQEKVAHFLNAEDLAEDAATHQKAAAKAHAQASAIENQVPQN